MLFPHRCVCWSLTIVKANLSFSFGLYFVYTSCCMPVWDYCIWPNLYTVRVLFHIDTGYIYCSNQFCYEFNTAFSSCGYFNLPIVRSKRQLILKHTLVFTCDLVLGVTFYSPRSRMRTFRVKTCSAARACFSVHNGIHKFPRKYERRDNISERSNFL